MQDGPRAAPAARPAPSPAEGTEPLAVKLRKARPALQAAPDHETYRASPYHPSEVIERIHSLGQARAWNELCQELSSLPDEDLELFEDEIQRPEHARAMPCARTLSWRVDAYWRAAKIRFAATHPSPKLERLDTLEMPVDVARHDVITGSHLPDGTVALTFDDGPNPTRTPAVLTILAAAGVRATFFEIGRNAANYPEVSKQVSAAGHHVGSHTFSHPHLPSVTEAHAESEINAGAASVALAVGSPLDRLAFFRFPYGAKTPTEQSFVAREGRTTFFWNMDSEDWRLRDPHALFRKILAELDREHHGIILFHDIHEQTVIVLPSVLAELAARHVKVVFFTPRFPPG